MYQDGSDFYSELLGSHRCPLLKWRRPEVEEIEKGEEGMKGSFFNV